MELSGKVFKVMPLESGEGKNGTWKKQQIIIEQQNGKYTKKVAITVWSDLTAGPFSEGADISFEFDVESREYNGKWYTDAKAWRINKNDSQATAQQRQEETKSYQETVSAAVAAHNGPAAEEQFDDDLPF